MEKGVLGRAGGWVGRLGLLVDRCFGWLAGFVGWVGVWVGERGEGR